MKPLKFSAEQIAESAIKATALELSLGKPIAVADKIPAGFRLRSEWAKLWDCGLTKAEGLIRSHVESGRMERKDFRVICKDGSGRKYPHYKAVK